MHLRIAVLLCLVAACSHRPLELDELSPNATPTLGSKDLSTSPDAMMSMPDLATPSRMCHRDIDCSIGEYCEVGCRDCPNCGGGFGAGRCVKPPLSCVATPDDVVQCGCDGMTYPSLCERQKNSVGVFDSGPCGPCGTSCNTLQTCIAGVCTP